jgi:radical SAM protein with 4Fe4S-binding SPASM domain
MNPRFFALVDILAERNIQCEFFTNGTLLTARMRQAILSRPNIRAISISCDGAEKTTFENLRVGADFESWKESVHEFLIAAKRQHGRTLSVGVNLLLSKGNLKEIEDIIRLAAKLGFDSVSILQPIPVDDIGAALCPSPAELSTVRQEDLFDLAGGLGLKILFFVQHATSLLKFMPRCTQPWEYVFIRANGDVAPCPAVFGSDKRATMGNIFQQEFNAIWRGERFREFRRTSASGTNALCRICPYH